MAKLTPGPNRGEHDCRLWGPRVDGKRVNEFRRFYGEKRTAQAEANAWEKQVRARWERGTSPQLTLAQFWQARIDAGTWTKAKTIQDKASHLQWANEDGFADLALVDVTPADVQAHLAWFEARPSWKAKRRADGSMPTMSPHTVLQHRAAIREMFRAATVENLVTGEPALVKSPAELCTVSVRPSKRTRMRLPTVGDVRAALAAPRDVTDTHGRQLVADWPRWFVLLIELAMATGMRRGELMGVQWGDVERHADGTAHVSVLRQVRGRTQGEAKAGGVPTVVVTPVLKTENSTRRVLIPAGTVAQLDTYRLEVEAIALGNGIAPTSPHWPTQGDRFVFTTNWDTPVPPAMASRWWGMLRQATGLADTFRLHDLRHLHATDLIDNGATFVDVADRLGNTVATVQDSYAHATAQGEQRAAGIVGGLLYGT